MDLFATGKVMHGGTYNSQPVAMAATVATLKALKAPGTYETLAAAGHAADGRRRARLRHGGDRGRPASRRRSRASRRSSTSASGSRSRRTTTATSSRTDRAGYVRLTTALLERGVRVLERGAWFISTAHDDAVIDETLAALKDALASL